MITFGEKLNIYIEESGLSLLEFTERAEVEYSTFRNILVNFKKNKGSLQIFLKYCYILGYKIDFILTNKETGEKLTELGISAGGIIKMALTINKMTSFEIAEKLGITVSAVNQRIKNLSENIGTINKFIELANTIGYYVDIAFVQ